MSLLLFAKPFVSEILTCPFQCMRFPYVCEMPILACHWEIRVVVVNLDSLYTNCIPVIYFRGGSRISSWGEGGALKKIVPSGGRRKNCWGIWCEKSRFYAKKSYFFQFEGGAPLLDPPCI